MTGRTAPLPHIWKIPGSNEPRDRLYWLFS